VSSVRDNRQRAARRARLEREMAARRDAAHHRRVLQGRIAAIVAGVVVVGAAAWIIVAATTGGKSTQNAATNGACAYPVAYPQPTAEPTTAGPTATVDPSATASASASAEPSPTASPLPAGIKDVGTPDPAAAARSGFQVMTLESNLGTIQIEMDLSKTPCTANSMAFLANQGFYDNTGCHRLASSIYALQCGDPAGTGYGGPNYGFADENLPTDKLPAYHDGDVAMANTGQPASNGSQFFFVYGVGPLQGHYTLWGKVISGLDIIHQVGNAGDDESNGAGDGAPLKPLTFTKVTVGPVTATSAATATPTPTPTATATATASPTAS
jgi:peptidyl-prolyl cis-trans isomerase B (cyclophilin B)